MSQQSLPAALENDLEAFRENWRHDILEHREQKSDSRNNKRKAKTEADPVVGHNRESSRGDTGTVVAERHDDASRPSASDRIRASRPRTSSSTAELALQLYVDAIESERIGKLNDAFLLYRRAFDLDSDVDRLYWAAAKGKGTLSLPDPVTSEAHESAQRQGVDLGAVAALGWDGHDEQHENSTQARARRESQAHSKALAQGHGHVSSQATNSEEGASTVTRITADIADLTVHAEELRKAEGDDEINQGKETRRRKISSELEEQVDDSQAPGGGSEAADTSLGATLYDRIHARHPEIRPTWAPLPDDHVEVAEDEEIDPEKHMPLSEDGTVKHSKRSSKSESHHQHDSEDKKGRKGSGEGVKNNGGQDAAQESHPVAHGGEAKGTKPYSAQDVEQMHISALPSEIIAKIVRHIALPDLDMASIEQLGSTCRALYLKTRDPALWMTVCERVWNELPRPPDEKGIEAANFWRQMYINRPRPRLDGVYVSKESYIRAGERDMSSFYAPVHIIEHYRYIRFSSDGRMLTATTPTDPMHFIHKLGGGRQWTNNDENGVIVGSYILNNDGTIRCQVVRETEESKKTAGRNKKSRRKRDPLPDLSTEYGRQHLDMLFSLATANKRLNSRLKWVDYNIRMETKGEPIVSAFDITQLKNFHFVRVKKFGSRTVL